MAKLKIVKYGNPILRKFAKPIKKIDAPLKKLVQNMIETMHEADGIGLAAPQIGKSISLFVVDVSPIEDGYKPMVFINAEIMEFAGESPYNEGCLSIPGVTGEVLRPDKIKLKYMDLEGKNHQVRADGILARVIQHEYDHILGKLFIDYLGAEKMEEFATVLKKLEAKNKK